MWWGVSWLFFWLFLNFGYDLFLIVDEFGIKLFEEIDYINEGYNVERFVIYFVDDLSVKVLLIYWYYIIINVLILEWIDGLKLLDIK